MEMFLLFAAVVVGLIVLQRLGFLPTSGKDRGRESRQELDTDMLYGEQPDAAEMTSPRVRGDEGEAVQNRDSRENDSDGLNR